MRGTQQTRGVRVGVAPVPILHARVSEDGKTFAFVQEERIRRQGYIKTLAGRLCDVTIRKHRNRRSDKQNKWWWGLAVPLMAQSIGYDRHEHEYLHYALVSKCFGTTFDPILKMERPNKRSSKLTTKEFSDLMEWAVRWAATEYGIVVPLPNEAEV